MRIISRNHLEEALYEIKHIEEDIWGYYDPNDIKSEEEMNTLMEECEYVHKTLNGYYIEWGNITIDIIKKDKGFVLDKKAKYEFYNKKTKQINSFYIEMKRWRDIWYKDNEFDEEAYNKEQGE